MKLPVYGTFIDFGVRNAQHRCRSSPPEFVIDDAVRESVAKEALLRARGLSVGGRKMILVDRLRRAMLLENTDSEGDGPDDDENIDFDMGV